MFFLVLALLIGVKSHGVLNHGRINQYHQNVAPAFSADQKAAHKKIRGLKIFYTFSLTPL